MGEELVDGPLIVGVLAVFAGDELGVGSDQEVCGEAEAAAVGGEWWEGVAAQGLGGASEDRARDRGPGSGIEQGAGGGFGAELAVELLFGIGDQGEGDVGGVFGELVAGRVKDDHFVDVCAFDLVAAADECVQVEVADGATCEAAELKVYES